MKSARLASVAALLAAAAFLVGCGARAGAMSARDAASAPAVQGFALGRDRFTPVQAREGEKRRLRNNAPWLEEAKKAGQIQDYRWGELVVADRPEGFETLAIGGIAGGEVASAWMAFQYAGMKAIDSMGYADPGYRCAAALLRLRPGRGELGADLGGLGLRRKSLWSLWPEEKGALYETSDRDVYALVSAADARLAGIVRGNPGDLLAAVPTLQSWYHVKTRIEEAVAIGAGLAQVKKYAETIALVPLPEDRAIADRVLGGYGEELESRASSIEASYASASPGRRCDLERQARALARTAAPLRNADRFRSLATRLTVEVTAQLRADAAQAERDGRLATAAGCLLVLHRMSDEAPPGPLAVPAALRETGDAPLAHARRLLAALAVAVVPAPDGSGQAVAEVYGKGALFEGRPIRTVAGLVPGDGAALPSPRVALAIGRPASDLHATERRETESHHYTVPNPAYQAWFDRQRVLRARSAEALAAVSSIRPDQVKVEESKQVQEGQAGHVTITTTTTKTPYYSAEQQRRLDAASDEAGLCAAELAAHERTDKPPPRTERSAPVVREWQRWSGGVTRVLSAASGAAREDATQRADLSGERLRTAGFQGSDDIHENIPDVNQWATESQLVASATMTFDESLGRDFAALVMRLVEARLAADLATRVNGGDRATEEAWRRCFFGLSAGPDASRLLPVESLGLEGK